MNKPVTVAQLIEILKDYDQSLPIVMNDIAMGWVNGVELEIDKVYRLPKDKSNKYQMLFENDDKKRTEHTVLKLSAYYRSNTKAKS